MSSKADKPPRRGVMFVLSSPSGAGKTTLTRRLIVEENGAAVLSVSATTRPPRPGERDGVDYQFLTQEAFDQWVAESAFLEWAHVFGNAYGTPRASVERYLAAGVDVVFDVDWQGGRALAEAASQDVVRVFILPPSIEELERRLTSRGDDASVIERRMQRARDEISHWSEYDYVLMNDDVERCFAEVLAILRAERLKRIRQTGVADLAAGMCAAADAKADAKT
ncbi:MAG: guanylate kinase [Caulobacterales bacterium]